MQGITIQEQKQTPQQRPTTAHQRKEEPTCPDKRTIQRKHWKAQKDVRIHLKTLSNKKSDH